MSYVLPLMLIACVSYLSYHHYINKLIKQHKLFLSRIPHFDMKRRLLNYEIHILEKSSILHLISPLLGCDIRTLEKSNRCFIQIHPTLVRSNQLFNVYESQLNLANDKYNVINTVVVFLVVDCSKCLNVIMFQNLFAL